MRDDFAHRREDGNRAPDKKCAREQSTLGDTAEQAAEGATDMRVVVIKREARIPERSLKLMLHNFVLGMVYYFGLISYLI